MTTRRTRIVGQLPLLLILALGAVLRLFRLDHASLWRDEIETMIFSLQSLREGIRLAVELPFIPRPPLYYILTHFFTLASPTVFSLRLLPALCSVASLPLAYLLGRRWFGRRTALLGTLLLAVAPLQVHYAQEGREYAFLQALALASFLFLDRALAGSSAWLVPWAAACAALLYTHHFGTLVIGSGVLAALAILVLPVSPAVVDRQRKALLLGAGLLVVAASWAPLASHLVAGVGGDRGMRGLTLVPPFSLEDYRTILGLFAFGNGPGSTLLLVPVLIGLLPFGTWRKRGLLFAAALALPSAGLLLFGDYAHAVRVRYFMFLMPVYLLVMARGMLLTGLAAGRRLSRRRTVAAAGLLWALLAVLLARPYLAGCYGEVRSNWKGVARFLRDHTPGDQAILVTGEGEGNINFHRFVLDHYAGLGPRISVVHPSVMEEDEVLALLSGGRPFWYVGTRPGERLPFIRRPDLLARGEYTMSEPLIFAAPTMLNKRERDHLAPFRYKLIYVIAFWPGRLTGEELERRMAPFLEAASRQPDTPLTSVADAALIPREPEGVDEEGD